MAQINQQLYELVKNYKSSMKYFDKTSETVENRVYSYRGVFATHYCMKFKGGRRRSRGLVPLAPSL